MTRTPPPKAGPATEHVADTEGLPAAVATWRETLLSVKKSVDEATAAVGLLRATLREMAPLWDSLGELEKGLEDIDWPEAIGAVPAELEGSPAKVTRLQPRTPKVPEETHAPVPVEPDHEEAIEASPDLDGPPPPRRETPVSDASAPYSCSVTVEEVGTRVKLPPLHRALGQIKGVRELSLKSYTNGVAVVSMDCAIELDASALEEAIVAATSKPCRVVSGDGPSFLVRVSDNPALAGRRQQEGAEQERV